MHQVATTWQRISSARRGVLTIAGGTAIGQALLLLAAPALTRLYTPTDFGLLTIITALSASLAAVAALRLELAVPIPESERDARSLVSLGLLSAAVTAALGTIVVALAGGRITELFDEPLLRPWLWCVPVLAAVMASFLVLNQLAIRHQRYGAVGRRNLLAAVTTLSTQVATGAGGLRPGGLIIGLTAGHAIGMASLLQGSGLRDPATRGAASLHSMRTVLSRYRRFPIFLAPAGLLNILGLQLPVLLFAYYYGSTVAGWLGLTQRVLALPITLMGQAVAQVYLGELSRDSRAGGQGVAELFHRTSIRLAALGAVALILILLFAPRVFSVGLGEEWGASGQYARALAVGLAAQIISSPLSQTLIVLGRQSQQLCLDASRLLLTAGSVIVSAEMHLSAITAMWGLGAALAASYTTGWWLAHRAVMCLPTADDIAMRAGDRPAVMRPDVHSISD